jgi:hypothetical protein
MIGAAGIRIAAAFAGLAAGGVAVVVVSLLLRSVLG